VENSAPLCFDYLRFSTQEIVERTSDIYRYRSAPFRYFMGASDSPAGVSTDRFDAVPFVDVAADP
jgi:hypothetical protein